MAGLLKSFGSKKQHRYGNVLRDVMLGGQDGLVNVLGVVLGVSAATSDKTIIIATGLAATFAESISMGAVAYTSFLSERDYYQKVLKKEAEELREFPEKEKDELRRIFLEKGLDGQTLNAVVETVSSNKKVWLTTMMDEDLHLNTVDTKAVLKTAVIVGLSALVGSLVPLSPFIFMEHNLAMIAAVLISGGALFALGAYEAKSYVGNWKRHGFQMLVIGLGAALIGFLVARIFHVVV